MLREEVERLRDQYKFFHWHLAFPQVTANGGFDVVLGNPPWDTLSPDRREYFSRFHGAMRSLSPTEQEAVIADLLTDRTLAAGWAGHQRNLFALVHFLKTSGRFTLYAPGNLGKGDFNVYRMFVELALRLVKRGGFAAQIVPAGFRGGANASAIRQHVFDRMTLKLLVSFVNASGAFFDQVHGQFQFLLYVAQDEPRTHGFPVAFGIASEAQLGALRNQLLSIDADAVRKQAPDTYAIPDVRSSADLTVAAKMLGRFPTFGNVAAGPPVRHYQRELDMGNDRDRFTADPAGLPVYEGRMVWQFDHRAKTYEAGHGNSSIWADRAFDDPAKAIVSQWRVLRKDIPEKLGERCDRYRLCFRDVAQPTDTRSLIATLVPPGVICGHKVPTIVFERELEWAYLPWLAVANSFVMDWMARSKLTSPTMSYTLLDSLPFPRPNLTDPWVQRAAPLVLRLICTAPEMTPFWNRMAQVGLCAPIPDNHVPPDAVVDDAERNLARAELDTLVAFSVYGLDRVELNDVLETFPAVRRQEHRTYGEYRTKRLVLEIYDAMAEAARSGKPYVPRLGPPADPRVANPLHEETRSKARKAGA